MSDHWHTYWENPDYAGLPTSWKLDEVPGVIIEDLEFPLPKRFEDEAGEGEAATVTYGYDDEVVLTARATYNGNASRITIKGVNGWLECKELCIPGQAKSSLTLAVGESKPANTDLFDTSCKWPGFFR